MVNNYYQKRNQRLRKEPCERYENLSKEEKHKIQKKAQERYKNFAEEVKGNRKRHKYYLECKKKLPDYRRNFYLAHKK